MLKNLTGPLVGVVVSVVLSAIGVVVARLKGGDVALAAIQVHAAATVVLLVAIWVKLNEKRAE